LPLVRLGTRRKQTGIRSGTPPRAIIMQQFIGVEEKEEFDFGEEQEETKQDEN
jgi:hypothetical protein